MAKNMNLKFSFFKGEKQIYSVSSAYIEGLKIECTGFCDEPDHVQVAGAINGASSKMGTRDGQFSWLVVDENSEDQVSITGKTYTRQTRDGAADKYWIFVYEVRLKEK